MLDDALGSLIQWVAALQGIEAGWVKCCIVMKTRVIVAVGRSLCLQQVKTSPNTDSCGCKNKGGGGEKKIKMLLTFKRRQVYRDL